jgi:hypothetical protein
MSSPPNPAPKRDKFAALASQQQQQQQQPKRDKFASLQARHQQEQEAAAAATATTLATTTQVATAATPSIQQQPVAAAPKRDKFASLAAASAAAAGPASAMRDKFASMAAAHSHEASSTEEATGSNRARRDKFAAVQQQKKVDDVHKKKQAVIDKCRQRDQVWKDLDTAEAAVTRLLQLAEQTASILAAQTVRNLHPDEDDNSSRLQTLPLQYQETVNEIHTLLKPHAAHIKPYVAPTRVNRMYLQRVEHRLAESKLRLLQEYNLEVEQQQSATNPPDKEAVAVIGKRKRDD